MATETIARLPILLVPHPSLKSRARPVTPADAAAVRDLVPRMFATMYEAPGIGLAAIQLAEPVRLIVVDPAKPDDPKNPMHLVNPEILWSSDERSLYEEGCLSIPEYYEDVERPAKVRVKYVDREGKEQEILADGLLATVLQHEIDHLDGVLFIDYLSKLKRDRVVKKFTKIAKHAASEGARRL